MSGSRGFEGLERAYDLIADAIDAAGSEQEALFLTKLSLVLAHKLDDLVALEEAIAIAGADLDV
ncbi:MAG TPA: hypothetical protein VHG33_06785 [Woeseiaceae bacterium]|nr:hypothetical protein [Woeseiaceae bacterium]